MNQTTIFPNLRSQEFNNKTGREINDYYPTPAPITQALIDRVELPPYFFEPCTGHGAIASVLLENGYSGSQSDILFDEPKSQTDATSKEFWDYWSAEMSENPLQYQKWGVVTNPPFNVAEEILPLAFEYSPWGAAFLLRVTYQEATQKRAEWLQQYADNLRYQITINPRVKFRSDIKSTDSCTCAWYVWKKDWSWASLGLNCPFQYITNWR